jgi:hypothetical protein
MHIRAYYLPFQFACHLGSNGIRLRSALAQPNIKETPLHQSIVEFDLGSLHKHSVHSLDLWEQPTVLPVICSRINLSVKTPVAQTVAIHEHDPHTIYHLFDQSDCQLI